MSNSKYFRIVKIIQLVCSYLLNNFYFCRPNNLNYNLLKTKYFKK